MKRTTLFSLLVAFLLCSLQGSAQPSCKSVKEGYFKIADQKEGVLYIKRTKSTQIERAEDGTVMQLKIKWLNDCTYTLQLEKFISNPKSLPELKDVLVVKILATTSSGYKQETTCDKYNIHFASDVIKISKDEFPE